MIIYKYLNQEGALLTVENKSVLLRMPEEFNDPFDCEFYISEDERENAFKLFINYTLFGSLYKPLVVDNKKPNRIGEQMKDLVLSIAEQVYKERKYTYQQRLEEYHSLVKEKAQKWNEEIYRKQFDSLVKETLKMVKRILLIACFSYKNDSILMWSHYAKNHTGACLEYEIEDKNFRPVEYTKHVYNFQLTKLLEYSFANEITKEELDPEDEKYLFVIEPVLHKSEDWAYEQEVRCGYSSLKPNKDIHDGVDKQGKPITLLKMPPIKKIYLGCKADDDFIKEMKDKCGSIPVVKMKKVDGEYKLEETTLD